MIAFPVVDPSFRSFDPHLVSQTDSPGEPSSQVAQTGPAEGQQAGCGTGTVASPDRLCRYAAPQP